MATAPIESPYERRPEHHRRSVEGRPYAVPAGPLRPERSEGFYEDLDVPVPEIVPGPPGEPPAGTAPGGR